LAITGLYWAGDGKFAILIKWKGYPSQNNHMEPKKNVHAKTGVKYDHRLNPLKLLKELQPRTKKTIRVPPNPHPSPSPLRKVKQGFSRAGRKGPLPHTSHVDH